MWGGIGVVGADEQHRCLVQSCICLNPLGTIQTFPTLYPNQYQYNHEYITDKPIYGKAQYQNGIEFGGRFGIV